MVAATAPGSDQTSYNVSVAEQLFWEGSASAPCQLAAARSQIYWDETGAEEEVGFNPSNAEAMVLDIRVSGCLFGHPNPLKRTATKTSFCVY